MPQTTLILSPSILSADLGHLARDIQALEAAGADWVHIDVMDGQFVPNLSMGPSMVAAARQATGLPLDVHLMVREPDRLLEAFARAGASWITVHAEACPHLHRTLQVIRGLGCHPGLALNPATAALVVEPVLELVDLVLVLGNNPGFSGQAWVPGMARKVAQLRRMLDEINPQAIIQVDGGMTPTTIPEAYLAGARSFVCGNAVFKHPQGIAAGVQALRCAVAQ